MGRSKSSRKQSDQKKTAMPSDTEQEEKLDFDFLKLQYQSISDRQISRNSQLWNIPSLLFVAQTILWGLSLDESVCRAIRCSVSFVSIIIGIISLQGFVRARLMEIADSEQLYAIEKIIMDQKHNNTRTLGMIVHHKLEKRTILAVRPDCENRMLMEVLEENKLYREKSLSQLYAFNLWQVVFWVSLLLAILIFLYNMYLLIMGCNTVQKVQQIALRMRTVFVLFD